MARGDAAGAAFLLLLYDGPALLLLLAFVAVEDMLLTWNPVLDVAISTS